MKLVSYYKNGSEQLALLVKAMLYDMQTLHDELPATMQAMLDSWDKLAPIALAIEKQLLIDPAFRKASLPAMDTRILAPLPAPGSCRDGYAFRRHVQAARRNRKVPMIPEFDHYPIFYFTNHRSITGPGDIPCMPDHFRQLDFELEAAIVIGKKGRNIPADKADNYIAGMMIMNDMSARQLQMEEMLLNLGPAKGKDFATAIGPWLVTLEELRQFEVPPKYNHTGKSWNLHMVCYVNGIKLSEGNLSEMDWTFAEIIERASYGADLYPGDVIGSGTVGTGCLLELNGTGKFNNAAYEEQWLLDGDEIQMEIQGLGQLTNRIVKEESAMSILHLKK